MERTQGRTEPLGSATIAAEIRGDEPVLRPRRTVQCRTEAWSRDGRLADQPSYTVTFMEGAVWDVARIASKLEVRRTGDRKTARAHTDLRFTGSYALLVLTRTIDAAECPATSAVLTGDERGHIRRTALPVFVR